jgi:hypothetical protein
VLANKHEEQCTANKNQIANKAASDKVTREWVWVSAEREATPPCQSAQDEQGKRRATKVQELNDPDERCKDAAVRSEANPKQRTPDPRQGADCPSKPNVPTRGKEQAGEPEGNEPESTKHEPCGGVGL